MSNVTIGVDVGQKSEPTGLAVIEQEQRPDGLSAVGATYHVVRYLDRLPAGTTYPQIATRLRDVVSGLVTRSQGRGPLGLTLFADVTGLGQPLIDLFAHLGIPVLPVYFTHGDRRTFAEDMTWMQLGKAHLVSSLQLLLQTGRLLLPRTPEAAALAQDLADYQIDVEPDANEHYGAFSVGQHDDLVTALGLGVQTLPPPPVQQVVFLDDLWTPEMERAFERERVRIGPDETWAPFGPPDRYSIGFE